MENKKCVVNFFLASILAAASLPAVTAAAADADPALVKVKTLQNAVWVYNSNILLVKNGEGYSLEDLDGHILTPGKYGQEAEYSAGYITARLSGTDNFSTFGLLDTDGNERIPFTYGNIQVLGPHWAAAFQVADGYMNNYDFEDYSSGSYYLIDTVDLYYLDGRKAVKAGKFSRDQYGQASAHGSYISIEDRAGDPAVMYDSSFSPAASGLSGVEDTAGIETDEGEYHFIEENGSCGIADSEGNTVLDPADQSVETFKGIFFGDLLIFSRGGLYGVLDLSTGKETVPPEYDSIEMNFYAPVFPETGAEKICPAGYFAVAKDGKYGFTDGEGNVTVDPVYDALASQLNGAAIFYTDPDNRLHLAAADGKDTIVDFQTADLLPVDYCSGRLFEYTDFTDFRISLFDWHGNKVLEGYTDYQPSGDGKYILAQKEDGQADLFSIDIYDVRVKTLG